MAKVSIVMPMYNVEKYIEECLESVQKQTLRDIEIIVVDDASKDNSLNIVKKMAKKDKRIKVISKPNKGYGNSMNVGFEAATGEYIGIVETDDYVDKRMFEDLYNTASKNDLDVVKSDFYKFRTKDKGIKKEYIRTAFSDENYNKIFDPLKNKNIFNFEINTWTGIYKASFIKKNHIKHNETPGAAYQDNGFWFQTMSLAKKIMFINKAYYYYRQDNPNSSINSKSKIFCMCEEYDFIRKFASQHSEIEANLLAELNIRRFWNYFYTYNRIGDEFKLVFLERFSNDFKKIIQNKELNISKIDSWVASILSRIISDYEAFYYDDLIYSKEKTLSEKRGELSNLRRSKYLRVGRKIAKLFLRKDNDYEIE